MEGPVGRSRSGPPWAWRVAVRTVLWFLRGARGWRILARPPEVVPRAEQPLIVVFNHTSTIDAFLVAYTLWRRLRHWVRPLVKAELFDMPLLGGLVRRAGAIPVARGEGSGRESAYDDAVQQLRSGETILIAPEGTTTHDGSLLPLRHGAARLALEAGVDLLVVTHFGAQRGFSPVARLPHRGAVVTMALDVVSPWADEDASSLTGRIAATMLDRSEELRATYPQPEPDAPWWPPYSAPASPTATARENLDRYRQSMAEAVAHARERMARIAEEHDVEHRVTLARDRAMSVAEEVSARSRARAEHLTEQTRERMEETRERVEETRERMESLASQARERAGNLVGHQDADPPSDDAAPDR